MRVASRVYLQGKSTSYIHNFSYNANYTCLMQNGGWLSQEHISCILSSFAILSHSVLPLWVAWSGLLEATCATLKGHRIHFCG